MTVRRGKIRLFCADFSSWIRFNQCCNKSSHWLRLDSSHIFGWRDLTRVFYLLTDLTWLESQVKMTLTWLWLVHTLTQVNEWLESWHSHTRLSAWIMWSCEPWLRPHLILGEKILNWYYLVTSVNIKMIHSTPLRFFFYVRWLRWWLRNWQNVLSVYKRGIHYTILTCVDLKGKITWLDLTWTIMWLELTWTK